jgi:hypothetical protein
MCQQVVAKVYTQFNLSFRQRPASRHGCFFRYPLDTSLGGSQGGSGCSEVNKYLLSLHGIIPQFLGHPIQNLVTIYRLHKRKLTFILLITYTVN